MSTIFISIASYRDPELIPTIEDCLAHADNPDNLRFSITWQHSEQDDWDNLDQFKTNPNFNIIDIKAEDSKGACWARNLAQQNYNNEDYTLQIDSHHRFVPGWDTECIKMVTQLQEQGYKKPLLTTYLPSYDPSNDPGGRRQEPWWMTFDKFIPEGAVFFLPAPIPDWESLTEPIPSRFLSAHFIFTLGKWHVEVPYDPEFYFHGEEISLAVRSYTSGYDLFHPHIKIAWHEYTRKGRVKHWDENPKWGEWNNECHRKNRALFGIDNESREGLDFSKHDFGIERTLQQYETFAGIHFASRGVQEYTVLNNYAPNPRYLDPIVYRESFQKEIDHQIILDNTKLSEEDYEFWAVIYETSDGMPLHRLDVPEQELKEYLKSKGPIVISRKFYTGTRKGIQWIVWPYSKSKGWCDKIVGYL